MFNLRHQQHQLLSLLCSTLHFGLPFSSPSFLIQLETFSKGCFPSRSSPFRWSLFLALLLVPPSHLPQCSPPLPPAFYIPSCRALSSNNFFVSRSDESLYIIVSKMEQRCPIPEGGGACKEKGTVSCTCQADSGFKISKQQNRTWETNLFTVQGEGANLGHAGS